MTVVCAALPEHLRQTIPYANPDSLDYVRLFGIADLDALLEVYGHVRATNPNNRVNIGTPNELSSDAYTAHLVVLGGVDWNILIRRLIKDVAHVYHGPILSMRSEQSLSAMACSDVVLSLRFGR